VAHVPVLLEETIALLAPRPGETAFDATLGGGGHAEALLRAVLPGGKLLGCDLDPDAIGRAFLRLSRLSADIHLVCGNFVESVRAAGGGKIDVFLADLGMSSFQVDEPARGFSFSADGPLDMRFDPGGGISAREAVNRWPQEELERIFFEFGGEPRARRFARAVAEARRRAPIETSGDLARAIARATRVFQALRIAVNRELENLDALLAEIPSLLAPGGRAAILAYHSLEDRRVKQAFRALAASGTFELLTHKPVRPGRPEVLANPRSRSARLRAVRRLR
jgi:16S rRNA (cytosine1402-N4)-methyltransferase